MVQFVICRSLFTLKVILNLLLYAVNINDIHVCVLLFFLDVQLPKAGFSKDCIFLFFIFFLFVSQSSCFKKLVKIKENERFVGNCPVCGGDCNRKK